jgi:hypothetical protein
VFVPQQVTLLEDGHRAEAELEFITYPEQFLGPPQFRTLAAVGGEGVRHISAAARGQGPFDGILNVFHPGQPAPRPCRQGGAHLCRHRGRQRRIRMTCLPGRPGHRRLDAGRIEPDHRAVPPPQPAGR